MTSGIEDTLNLTPLKDAIAEQDPELAKELANLANDVATKQNNSELSTILQNDKFLGIGEKLHDKETDEIRTKALAAYKDVFTVAQQVDPMRSARLFEVAGQFLKTALDGSNSRVDRELNVAKLRIQAKRLNIQEGFNGALAEGVEIIADRNEVLKQMIAERNNSIIDVDAKFEEEQNEDLEE